MRNVLKLSIVAMFISSSLFAANPRPGWYAGVVLGGAYAPAVDYLFLRPNGTKTTNLGNMSFKGMGGGGGQLGYKWFPLRVEIELLFLYNPYDKLTSGPATYTTSTKNYLRFSGNTSTFVGFFNSYYDFYTPGCNSDWAPYIGAGVGYAYVSNSIKWYRDNTDVTSAKISAHQSMPAAQGILGAAYFLDDYTSFALDYRYVTTAGVKMFNNQQLTDHTINITFNGSFTCF